MPRSESKSTSPRRRAATSKSGSRTTASSRASGGSAARTRARERALRKSGEVGLSRSALTLGVLGIFVFGFAAGGVGGLYLERAGLLPSEQDAPTLAEAPASAQSDAVETAPVDVAAVEATEGDTPPSAPAEPTSPAPSEQPGTLAGVAVEPGLDLDPDAEASAVAAVAPAAGSDPDGASALRPVENLEPADLPPTGSPSALARADGSTLRATIDAEPLTEGDATDAADAVQGSSDAAADRDHTQVAALSPEESRRDETTIDDGGTDSIADAIRAFDPAADAAGDPTAEATDTGVASEESSSGDDIAASVPEPQGDTGAQDTNEVPEALADVAPPAPDAPALTEVAALAFPPLPRSREVAPRDFSPSEPLLVYEEPVRLSDLLPPPSDAELDAFAQEAGLVAKPMLPASSALPWQRHAVQVAGIGNRPMIAVVIDDLGLNRPNARKVVALPSPLTLAFMTYAEGIEGILARARDAGHELLVHMPMEPSDPRYDPGPNVLRAGMQADELKRRIEWGLRRFDGYVGINNHMGSKFTTSMEGMAVVMETLQRRGLLYLDSVTAGSSVGAGLAERTGVPFAVRDVFIDNDHDNPNAIRRQLAEAERIALRRGYAVAIGHPHRATIEVLTDWLAGLEARGFALVPISAVVQRRIEIAGGNGDAG